MRTLTIAVRGHVGTFSEVTIDDEDASRVRAKAWRIGAGGYPMADFYAGYRNGKELRRRVPMHRWILGLSAEDRREVDHINRNKLDNRRSNLRICTRAENAQNIGPKPRRNRDGKDCGYRGVSWGSRDKVWRAHAMVSGKLHALGSFKDPEQANAVLVAFRAAHMPFSQEARS